MKNNSNTINTASQPCFLLDSSRAPDGAGDFKRITTAYVLAGGMSRRMGRDKLFIDVGRQTLLDKALSVCKSVFEEVKISAPTVEKFADYPFDVITDDPAATGPIAGVIAALRDCGEGACFVTAADLVDLNVELIEEIVRGYSGEGYFGVAEGGRVQPLCGVYRLSALGGLTECVRRGQYSVRAALSGMRCGSVNTNLPVWRNLNRPEDLKGLAGHV